MRSLDEPYSFILIGPFALRGLGIACIGLVMSRSGNLLEACPIRKVHTLVSRLWMMLSI